MCWLAGLSWRLAECHGRGLNPGRLRRNALPAAHHPPWWLTVARSKKQCACRFDSQRRLLDDMYLGSSSTEAVTATFPLAAFDAPQPSLRRRRRLSRCAPTPMPVPIDVSLVVGSGPASQTLRVPFAAGPWSPIPDEVLHLLRRGNGRCLWQVAPRPLHSQCGAKRNRHYFPR